MNVGAITTLGPALAGAGLEAQFAALALSAQLTVMQDIAQGAVQLIQVAAIDSSVGSVLDIQV